MLAFNNDNFNIACNETYEIIMHLDDELKSKISPKLINFLKEQSVKNYKVNIDFSKNILEQDILFETKSIMSIIYRDYIVSPEKKKELVEWDIEYDNKVEKQKRKMYSDNLFPKKVIAKQFENEESCNYPTVLKKESFIYRFISKLKNIFHF